MYVSSTTNTSHFAEITAFQKHSFAHAEKAAENQ
jgi:hypothetical protein